MTAVYTSDSVAFSQRHFLSAVAAGVLDGFLEGDCEVGGGGHFRGGVVEMAWWVGGWLGSLKAAVELARSVGGDSSSSRSRKVKKRQNLFRAAWF